MDHSEVQELVLAGVITREQARTHPRRNVVTRALGSDSGLLPDHWLLPAISGDRYLICSDGLFSELPDDAILPLLAAGAPQQAAEALVAAANDAGGHDNVTVVVVDIDSDDDGADEATLPREALPDEANGRTVARWPCLTSATCPGRADAVAGDQCWALVEASPDSPAVTRIWQGSARGPPRTRCWPRLLADGLGGVPGFALLTAGTDGQHRLFCRGAVGATVVAAPSAGAGAGAAARRNGSTGPGC